MPVKYVHFVPDTGFHIKYRSRQKVETQNKSLKILNIDIKALKKRLISHPDIALRSPDLSGRRRAYCFEGFRRTFFELVTKQLSYFS